MENTTLTVYSSYLQACTHLKKPFVMVPKTTLNEKLNINPSVAPQSNEYPSFGYLCVGIGGARLTVAENNVPITVPIQHSSTDASPYDMIPFVLREVNNDLSASQRELYALRRMETINNRNYFAYYLRRVDLGLTIPKMYLTKVVDGVSDTKPFIPSDSNLNPSKPELTNAGVNVVSGDMTSVSAPLIVNIGPTEVDELLNVAKIKFNEERLANITEMGFCTGLDKVMTSPGVGNSTIQMNEAICVQIATHVNTAFDCQFLNDGFKISVDVGSLEPLFSLEK